MAKLYKRYIVAALIFVMLFIGLASGRTQFASASASSFSDVLDDLREDDSFNIEEYPGVEDNYSLQVIKIAESKNNELYVYVYNPCGITKLLPATQINMSLAMTTEGTQLYELTLVSVKGVFQKCRVEALTVSSDEVRYYNIFSVYRAYDEKIDGENDEESPVKYKAFAVGKKYEVSGSAGKLRYRWEGTEVIRIADKYVGYCDYSDGFRFSQVENTRSHYVAFDTDKPIDQLLQASVSYKGYSYHMLTVAGKVTEYNLPVSGIADIKWTDFGENAADWFLGKKVVFPRIEKVADFLRDKNNKFSSDVEKKLSNYQWVLRFYESQYNTAGGGSFSSSHFHTYLEEVTILELSFVTDLRYYRMGAVDDIQASDTKPSNSNTDELDTFGNWTSRKLTEFWEWLKDLLGIPDWLLTVILIALALLIILPILSIIFPPVWTVLKLIFKGLWWLLTLPFRGIAALIKKKGKK